MADLSVKYLSLELKNPCIIASSPLTADIDGLVRCEKAGAGAVVLKSIFEEQITSQVEKELDENEQYLTHSDAVPYFEKISKDYYINRYLDLVRKAKKELSVPVIASVNCTDADAWTEYIRSFEAAGADALELNYYPMSADWRTEGSRVDRLAADFAARVRSACSIPVSVKIGCEYSSLAWIIRQMDHSGVDGLVHVSQISHEWLENPTSVLTIGEEVDAKILVLDPANKKMTLSIKALLPEPEVTKVRPRRENNNGEDRGERKNRKPRQPRENREDGEFREWTEGGIGGASIAEMLQNKNND